MANSKDYIPEERTLLEGLLDYVSIFLEYKAVIIIITLLSALIIVAFSVVSLILPPEKSLLPNQYRAYAIVLFQEGGNANMSSMLSAFGIESGGEGSSASQLALEILDSRTFVDRIIDKFDIVKKYDIKKKIDATARNTVLENSEYSFKRDSGALTIAFTDIDPQFAADLVNYKVTLLEEWFLNKGVSLQSYELSLMEEKLNGLTTDISRIEGEIEGFQREHGVLDIQEIAIAQSAMLTDLRTKLNQVELEIRDYLVYTTIEDPALVILNSQRNNIINQINRIEEGYTSADGRKMPSLEELPQLSLDFAHMQAELSIKNQLFQTLSERFEVTKLIVSEGNAFNVFEYAEVPKEKVGPSRARLCLMVTVGSFFCSIILSLFLNMIKNVSGDSDVKKILKKGSESKKTLVLLFCLVGNSLFAQDFSMPGTFNKEAGSEPEIQYIPQAIIPVQALPDEAEYLQLAISSRQYPVTPGDIYTLTFLQAGESVSNTLLVESDYTINMTIFGKLNALGMSFAQLKPVIEQKIADAYPRSLPSLTITSVGVFQVPVSGEISQSRYVTAWGLSRLSEVLEGVLGDYSSVRDIEIHGRDRDPKKYDLIMAMNQGILDQDPTVKPDDRIHINRVQREVQIVGEVYKPGVYQLLEGEGINVVTLFTGGLTPMADPSRIRVDRYSGERPQSFFMPYIVFQKGFDFHHGDIITIPSILRTQTVVYIEGGVVGSKDIEEDARASFDEYDRIVYSLKDGETLYDVLDSLRNSFAPFADLEHGYVLRDGNPMSVNMQDLIYDYNEFFDIRLQPFDKIVIPVLKPTIYVTGAVISPGAYAYQPEADSLYYVNQASGFDVLRNNYGKVIVYDESGKRRRDDDPIQPGDTLDAVSNNFIYNFNQYVPAIATGLGLIITIITITNYLNQNSFPDDN